MCPRGKLLWHSIMRIVDLKDSNFGFNKGETVDRIRSPPLLTYDKFLLLLRQFSVWRAFGEAIDVQMAPSILRKRDSRIKIENWQLAVVNIIY